MRKMCISVGLWFLLMSASGLQAMGAESPLLEAVKQQDLGTVRALIAEKINVNVPSVDGSTALHWASNYDNLETVNLLLDAGADVNVSNRYGITPLVLACESGNKLIIEKLLDAGANVNYVHSGGESVLMTASRTATTEIIELLLAYGADPNMREPRRGQTALMWAAAAGNIESVKGLVAGGADLFALSEERDFRFRLTGNGGAGRSPKGPIIQFSPLMFAVRGGHLDVVTNLLNMGADPNDNLPDGTAALIVAIINAHWELASYLLDHGADPNGAASGWAPLHQIARSRSLTVGHVPQPVQTGRLSSLGLAEKLLEMGADVNARITRDGMRADGYRTQLPRIGATPYLLAAKGVDHQFMRLLLDYGADPLITNEVGMRPLMVAAGVALHAPGEDTGTHEDALEAIKLAYSVEPDVNYTDQRGHTALHGAARRGAVSVVEFLIDKGAKLDAVIMREDFIGQSYGKKGFSWTPLTIALGRQRDGHPIFLGEQRMIPAALVLYQAMREQGVQIDEHEASIDDVKRLLTEAS